MPLLKFTVDAALLKELGERLVGKPAIALAELVKNSYDADATQVTIEISPEQGRIVVTDDGNGMNFAEFEGYWMRIGTPHRASERGSRHLGRKLTGSKGVGRLAAQFLAGELAITTVPRDDTSAWLQAHVNWDEAVTVGDLTEASVQYSSQKSPVPFPHGTSIVLSRLKHAWDKDSIQDLARELWWLQPPFRLSPSVDTNDKYQFSVRLLSPQRELETTFEHQIRAIMGIWTARLVGRNLKGSVILSLEFAGEAPRQYQYSIADFPHNKGKYDERANLNAGEFEIRVFLLRYRQPHGIKIAKARDYFREYGGIHVYDSGFRLPYYGVAQNDWLRIEWDTGHRLSRSKLLPASLQIPKGMQLLPTLGRLFGVVNVDTSLEPNLDIMITRDRLAETAALEDLRCTVRYALDLYAHETARRELQTALQAVPIEETSEKLERVEEVLRYYEAEIPPPVYREISERIREATFTAEARQEAVLKQLGLLGSLATAGISALAYQHELRKQFTTIQIIIERLGAIQADDPALRDSLGALGSDLSLWLHRAKATNALFDYLADAENMETRSRFHASAVLDDVKRQMEFFARGSEVDTTKVDEQLLLPMASLVEWSAIFQNVFSNAFNAMLDSERRLLQVSSRAKGKNRVILIQDTGHGVDLRTAEDLFQPFVRKAELSAERRALGYGGTGLGLTIVRLVADNIGCKVAFAQPDEDFCTAFSLSWRETGEEDSDL